MPYRRDFRAPPPDWRPYWISSCGGTWLGHDERSAVLAYCGAGAVPAGAPSGRSCCWFLTRSSRVTSLMAVGASLMAARPPRLAAVHPVDPGCLSGRGGGAVASCASTSDGSSAADRVKPNASAGQGSFAGPAANGFASRRIRAPGRDHLLRQRCDGRKKSSKTPALSDLLPPTRDKAHPAFLPAHALPEQIAESVRHPLRGG